MTPSSAHKDNINTEKSVSDSNIQCNNNFTTPADIFNRDNASRPIQKRNIDINDVIPSSFNLYDGSRINTPQNVTSETKHNQIKSSSAMTQVPEKPTKKTIVSTDRYPSFNWVIVASTYPFNNSHHIINKKATAEKNFQENQIGLCNANNRKENVNELTKSYKNEEDKLAITNKHWRNSTNLVMGFNHGIQFNSSWFNRKENVSNPKS